MGISFLPETTVKREIDKGTLVSFDIPGAEFSIASQVMYHRDKWISPALRALLNLADTMLNILSFLKYLSFPLIFRINIFTA